VCVRCNDNVDSVSRCILSESESMSNDDTLLP